MTEPPFTTAHLDDVTSIAAGGATWKPVRRHLGVSAFGINAFTAAAEGGELIEEHDELGPSAGHHQELYFVATGAARFTVDGTESRLPPARSCSCRNPRPGVPPRPRRRTRRCS